MKGRVLTVLMWKHCVVRKRRYLHTTIEYLAPIVIIILLFMFRDNFNPIERYHDKYFADVDQPEALSLNRVGKPPVVLYTPNTRKTQELMNSVAGKFDKISRRRTTFIPFEFDDDIFNNTKEMEYDEAIVIFQNMSGRTWPQALNYTIRMKNAFMTGLHQSLDDNVVPHSSFGSIYEKFMVLQWAIDTSYLELLTDTDIEQNVTLQEFPYVRRQGSAASSVSDWMRPVCWLSLLLNFVFLMTRLLEERSSGIQELLKMMGVSSNTLALSHILNVAPPGILFSVLGAMLLKVSSNPLLKESSVSLIFVTLALYYMTIVSFAFAASYITETMQYAVSLSVLTYVVLWLPVSMLTKWNLVTEMTYLSGLLPHIPMIWIWTETSVLERVGQGLTKSTMFEKHSSKSGSAFAGFILLIGQAIFFFLLAWYLDHVKPGKYGQALPWNFLCQRHYWRKNDITPNSELEQLEEPGDHDQRYFQPVPPDLEAGIRVLNVSKVFPNHVALRDVSLDVHRGEITVLLGHNGAGKTTLMSIITGMLSASSGQVFVNGVELGSEREAVRRRIGLCPQHNLFFSDLTVLEHVMLFTLFKKGTFNEARESSEKLLRKLGILDKKNSMSGELSGGMKRRLQLACALAGDADVLILDEPTSGLDVETRRELWELLLALRGSRTVLLSTHFMEEADALGDRVAALHQGRVRCYATPLYLKKAIGTGYRLTFTTKGVPNENAITRVVTSHVPDATVKEFSLNSISYNLPATASHKFPKMFASLETKRSELAIVSIGVGVSTLEEVFLRLCSDIDTTFTRDEVDDATTDNEPTFKRVTGFLLYLRQTKVLLLRQLNYVRSKILWFMILQVILPILMIAVFTKSFNGDFDKKQGPNNKLLALNMDMYRAISDPRALYNVNISDANLHAVSARFPHVLMQRASDVADVVLRSGERNVFDYNKYLVGVELNSTDATVLYTTTTVRHAAPVALNLLTNIIATQLLPWADGRTITTNNYPLQDEYADSRNSLPVEAKPSAAVLLWAVTLIFIILATHIAAVSLPCKERISGARHIHIMAGAPAALYWGTTLLAHTVTAVFTLVIPACLIAALLDDDHTWTEPIFIVTLFVILMLGSMSFFALMYVVSFFFAERGASILLVAIILLFGLIVPGLKSVKDMFNTDESMGLSDLALLLSSHVVPPHTLMEAATLAALTAHYNALCDLNRHRCPAPGVLDYAPGFDPDLCCATKGNWKPYLSFVKTAAPAAPALMIICLFIQLVVLMTVVWLLERGAFLCLIERAINRRYRPRAASATGADACAARADACAGVRAERAHVTAAIALPAAQITDAMLVSDLHKNYWRLNRPFNAVKGINFSVKKGECFGLLGVNGAGKSTTFKMLTAKTCPTKGQVFANGNYLTGDTNKYLRGLGYCPQFFGLDDFQTGMQNLTLLLTLRGCTNKDVAAQAKSWLKVLGLEKYANRAVSQYSGGCARRLAAGCALAVGAPLTLLDEPTAGVDVAARRRVWAALRTALKQGRALIITSHSMDEMEALCHRIAIMSAGEIWALDSPAALRAGHAAGHAVLIKVATRAHDETDSSAPNSQSTSQLNQLKSQLHQKFNCTLKDEHQTTLHYHINETMPYSVLFRELEALREAFPLIEDYSVTETTLEEVFLSFARPPDEGPPAEGPQARPV